MKIIVVFSYKLLYFRFKTYAEPGPIDNNDFLCPHGGVAPEKLEVVERLSTIITQSLWEFFYEK